jgi:hypothetical protein
VCLNELSLIKDRRFEGSKEQNLIREEAIEELKKRGR